MKKIYLTTCLFLLYSLYLKAEEIKGVKKTSSNNKVTQTGCTVTTAQTDLDISNVRARIFTGGDMWWDLSGSPQYEVPKGTGKHSMYAGSLWIGGIDAGGQIKAACQTYRQTANGGGNDYWAGPIDPTTVDITPANCIFYDRHWKLNKSDVVNFVNTGTTTVPDIINYPGNSPYVSSPYLAPFFDNNGDGIYNYLDGDYPYFNLGTGTPDCCDILHGDQCLWWVINDVGDIKTETDSPPIGLEIQCQAFAFDSTHGQTVNTTFYQYKMINRSPFSYFQCYFGQWVDSDLGYYLDDYVGCEVGKGVGYCYNGDAIDDLPDGYGQTPPVIGVDILEGPHADIGDGIDNNWNGTIDEPNEDITMSKFVYYNNNNDPATGNPVGYQEFYNYLRGIWRNGVKMTYGGNGYNTASTDTCNFMFPGLTDPSHTVDWTEITSGNAVGDRRFIMSAGQFTMLPGEVNCITVAVVWARAASGSSLASLPLMLNADSIAQLIFDSCFTDFTINVNQLTEGTVTAIAPNPFSEKTSVFFNNPKGENYSFKLFDINGTLVKTVFNIKSNFLVVERENLKSGMYVFKLTAESGTISSGKLVVD
jgi:type IX secretion system substrate protein